MKKLITIAMLWLPGFALAAADDFPGAPEPGKCYARVVVPAKYKVARESILVKPETYSLKTIPAIYGMTSQQVVVREENQRTRIIPATYKTIKKRILLQEETRTLSAVPATYKVVTKKIMVKPAGFEWKKGTGPLQKVDHATGEILCYTETPAVYKNVNERVLVSQASTVEKIIPAKYGVIAKKVVATPERVVTETIPEVTKSIRVRKMIEGPRESKIRHAAQYKTINKKVLADKSYTEWQPILCKTNATPAKIGRVQKRLQNLGYYKGPIDGLYGNGTYRAVSRFQRKAGLATGGLTEETLEKLSVTL